MLKIQEIPFEWNAISMKETVAPTPQDFRLTIPIMRHVAARWDDCLQVKMTTGEVVKIDLRYFVPCPLRYRLPIFMGLRQPYRSTLVLVSGTTHFSLQAKRSHSVEGPPQVFSPDRAASGLPMDGRDLQPPFREMTELTRVEEEEPQSPASTQPPFPSSTPANTGRMG